jgi:ribosomal protein S18 acetylase RimI-like enzyme
MRDPETGLSIFTGEDIENHLGELAGLLSACVHDGASIGFVLPFSGVESARFWTSKVLPGVRGGGLVLLVVRQGGRIAGAVQLDHDTPANQPHRAEVRKLLVHPDFRRQGLARVLMTEIEQLARSKSRGLITLDTRTGDKAEPLYAALGYQVAGVIPGYCRDTLTERLDSTTIMYKTLQGVLRP